MREEDPLLFLLFRGSLLAGLIYFDDGAGGADLGVAAGPIAGGVPQGSHFAPDQIARREDDGKEDKGGVEEGRHGNVNLETGNSNKDGLIPEQNTVLV